jgi:hypothetical protein
MFGQCGAARDQALRPSTRSRRWGRQYRACRRNKRSKHNALEEEVGDMGDATISTPEASVGEEVISAGTVDTEPVVHGVKVANPLKVPYRTGSYLIYDEGGTDHFRRADGLAEHAYRASGSHQLDLAEFVRLLGDVVKLEKPTRVYLIDLREETHGFFDLMGAKGAKGVAVSWYADNDFSNVGQTPWWITEYEKRLLDLVQEQGHTQVFSLKDDSGDNRGQGRVLPESYTDIVVGAAYNEARVAEVLAGMFKRPKDYVEYVRIPLTDHCAPSDTALEELVKLRGNVSDTDWVHFHCHGGDGRTTTFLALYDMLCWKKSGTLLPSLEDFACRQCQLFSYCLNPYGCRNPDGSACGNCAGEPLVEVWKSSLAEVRWRVLQDFLNSLRRS